ncbi:MAG TPA: glycosyltransferase [Pseudolabrys sp.]|nr:glycosyltransferase [Pseudolabrys sp.]
MKILCVFGRYAYGDPRRGDGYEYANFLPALAALGHETELFDSFDRSAYVDFAELNQRLLERVAAYRPDVIFFVLMNYEVWSETLDILRAGSPAILVNWGTDDSWKFDQVSRFLIPHLDVHVTTDKRAQARAAAAGFRNVVHSQWGASSAQVREPVPSSDCIYDVSFIGNIYGERRAWIDGLRGRGVKVAVFGHGSEGGVVGASEIPEIYRKSRISLNFSGSGRHLAGLRLVRSRQIKARVFEVPGAGGALLTQAAEGLSDYFRLGEEIDTFDSLDELAGKVSFYLANPQARDRMARSGHARVVAEHLYEHRFAALLHHSPAGCRSRGWRIDPGELSEFVEIHRRTRAIRPLRLALGAMTSALLGRERGARGARRIVFEASWRLAGKRTFGAAGLPGRLFFRES